MPHRDSPGVKVDDIADIGTAPGVNALVRIADDADVAPAGSQDFGQGVLGMVRILVFVDQDILETGLVLFPNIFLFLQKAHGQEQEVSKSTALFSRSFSWYKA